MKQSILLVVACVVVVGCFGRPVANVSAASAPENGEEIKASPVATQEQETIKTTPTPEESRAPTSAPVVAQDDRMTVTNIEVGDPDLSGAVRFTVQGVGNVTISEQFTSPRLFRIRDTGRATLVSDAVLTGNGKAVDVAIPESGVYLVAGEEKPLPFENAPLQFRTLQQQYRVQQECDSQPWVEGPAGVKFAIAATTKDTSFPSPVDVYIHHASGGADRPDAYSFQALVDDIQPAGVTLNYIRDIWNTRLAPDVAAQVYNKRWRCDPGRSRIDICHSAGCLKALIAMVMAHRALDHDWNHLGIIAVSPAFGGSHTQIKEIFDAWHSLSHKPKRFGALFFLAQRDIGYLAVLESAELRLLKQLLTGTSFTLYNELGRALAWDGVGTGIPTITYGWFSEHDFGIPYLKKRLTPNARFLMPKDNALAEYAPETIVNYNAGGGEYFNYIEALRAYYTVVRQYWTKGEERIAGKVDVIATYLGSVISKEARAFEEKYGTNELLNNSWAILDPSSQYRLEFEKAAMPWLHEFIGEAPSVVPQLNENKLNDGALTVAQQLGLRDGPSILVKSSDSVSVDEDAVRNRVPGYIDEFKTVPGMDHIGAGITNAEIRAQMRAWIVKRTRHLKEEETAYILTNEDKDGMRGIFFPQSMPVTRFYQGMQFKVEYWFGNPTLTFTQAPVRADQKNRVRMVGADWVDVRTYEDVDGVGYVFQKSEKRYWTLEEDFIRRNGVWHLVIK